MKSENLHGGFSNIAASTRVRYARNLKGTPYLDLTLTQKKEIADKVWNALGTAPVLQQELELHPVLANSLEAKAWVEQHLISPELCAAGGYVILSKDRHIAIMIGEEDHIRLQVMGTGFCPAECAQTAKRLLSVMESSLTFDYDEKLGYLTSCPTNLGTGLRVSVMLHLYMLTANREMEDVINAVSRAGFTVRGTGGEGSKAQGAMYQLSNQLTLGFTDDEITQKVIDTATSLIQREKKLRNQVMEKQKISLWDQVCRSAGQVKTARKMDSQESTELLSDVLLGLERGILTGIQPETVETVLMDVMPARLTQLGKNTPEERDIYRARMIREKIGNHLQINEETSQEQ